jgi:hypothetical protein
METGKQLYLRLLFLSFIYFEGKPESKGEQSTIDQSFKPNDKRDDNTHPNKNDPSSSKVNRSLSNFDKTNHFHL